MRKVLVRAELCHPQPLKGSKDMLTVDSWQLTGKRKHVMRLAITCMVTMTIAITTAKAQEPLHIGMTVPDVQLDSMVNYSSPSAKLSDFKGKIIILDFFATWCGSCRKNIPLLDSLQRKYKDRLQVVLVSSINTKDDVKRTKAFYSRLSATGLDVTIPAIVQDSVLMQLLPFTTIPHYVWLDDQLTVKAITSSAFVTEENIVKMLSATKQSPKPKTN